MSDSPEIDAARNAVLIAGPTAGGKSALAVAIAERTGGAVVNADSMQVYSVLDVLTARPATKDMHGVDHCLFGHVDPALPYSTGAWLRDVRALLRSDVGGRPLIFVGGTGLYFKALTEGLSRMPAVPPAIRDRWRAALEIDGPGRLHAQLGERDAVAAASIGATDGQRIVRALELIETAGAPLATLMQVREPPLVDLASATAIIIEPDRVELHRRINGRFDNMIAGGALEEVRALLDLDLDPSMPAMKAIGVRDLAEVLSGRLSLDEAGQRAKAATRQYAKRQSTWFRNQMGDRWLRFADATAAIGGLRWRD